MLHQTVREHLETFLSNARDEERPVPRFVEREFRAYLECGILAHGFLRVHCRDCGCDRLVAFSCKGRGFCPSCGGRRMAQTAAQLVDAVLPRAPVRQWVLTLPFFLRYRLAFDAGLTRDILGIFIRALFASLRRRARMRGLPASPRCGAVTFIQRFGDALNLNVHFHTLVLDGVYDGEARQGGNFRPLPPPENGDVDWVARRAVRGIRRLLIRRGLGPDADPNLADTLPGEEPFLAALYGASVHGRVATGPRSGRRLLRFAPSGEETEGPPRAGPRCVTVDGVSIHAEVAVPARDRRRLQRLCRYTGRPPVATRRLSRLPDGRLLYRLKRRWRDGTTHVVFEPLEFLEKLAALVPPPRIHQIRYHGILGPAAGGRRFVIPTGADPGAGHAVTPPDRSPRAAPGADFRPGPRGREAGAPDPGPLRGSRRRPPVPGFASGSTGPGRTADPPGDGPGRDGTASLLSWAELLRRVFAVDALKCPRCGGRMRILAAIQTPEAIRDILEHLGLPSRAPPIHAARRPPEVPPSRTLPELPDPPEA